MSHRNPNKATAGVRLLLAGALVLAACTQNGGRTTPPAVEPGGVLRVGMIYDPPALLDPQREYGLPGPWELFHCCLLRTLLSYDGRSGENGGSTLHPDLATSMPNVSADGLTWTFTLRTGIKYAPPLQDTEIQAQDFVRALERTARLGAYKPYYSQI